MCRTAPVFFPELRSRLERSRSPPVPVVPIDGISVFSNIFAEDTIAASAYNSFQASVEKRFSHGLQFQVAYTLSKSLDWASSFEETVNPFDYRASRALSLFNSKQRFVINYVWDIPARRVSGFKGKVLDDWQLSWNRPVPERLPRFACRRRMIPS